MPSEIGDIALVKVVGPRPAAKGSPPPFSLHVLSGKFG